MRDIVLEETVFFDFTTRAFATGIPTVLAGTPVLSVLEENNATPITAGVSVSVNRASVVGLNMATIVATAANGYESGKGYSVYISTGTVSSVSVVGEIVTQFTIGASAAAQDLANVTDGLTALKTGIDAIPTTAMRGTDSAALATVCTETRLAELDAANLPADVAAIDTATMRGTDGANTVVPDAAGVVPTLTEIVDGVWDELQSGHTTASTFGKFLDVEVSSVSGGGGLTQQNVRDAMKLTPTAGAPSSGSVDEHLDDILLDTDELQSDWVDGGRLDLILDARASQTSVNNLNNISATDVWNFATRTLTAFSFTVDCNVKQINGATVLGNGTVGNLWRGS